LELGKPLIPPQNGWFLLPHHFTHPHTLRSTMLPATFLKVAIFALATVPAGFARPLGSGPDDLQVRDEQIETRSFAVDEIYGRDLADDYVSARELNEGVQELELRQFAALARIGLRLGKGAAKMPSGGGNNNNDNNNKPKSHGFFGLF